MLMHRAIRREGRAMPHRTLDARDRFSSPSAAARTSRCSPLPKIAPGSASRSATSAWIAAELPPEHARLAISLTASGSAHQAPRQDHSQNRASHRGTARPAVRRARDRSRPRKISVVLLQMPTPMPDQAGVPRRRGLEGVLLRGRHLPFRRNPDRPQARDHPFGATKDI